LIENSHLRIFITNSGKIELTNRQNETTNDVMTNSDNENCNFEAEFKIIFQKFDDTYGDSFSSDIFSPFTKSYEENQKDDFTKEYRNFRKELADLNLSTESGSIQRFRTSTRHNQFSAMLVTQLIFSEKTV
jgi:hypothetical protein